MPIQRSHNAKPAKRTYNPLRADPSRTATLRRQFIEELNRRFNRVTRQLRELVVTEDAFGLGRNATNPFTGVGASISNARWQFRTLSQKVVGFGNWLKLLFAKEIADQDKQLEEDTYWHKYVEEGYRKGAGRAFDETRKPALASSAKELDFWKGTKAEFLRSSFGRPESIEKVKLLAGRTLTDLVNVSDDLATRMSRNLTDGLVQGQNPRQIAATMVKELDLGRARAERIARTEIIRAHAEGAIDAYENLGVDQIGVMVEWDTAGDGRVCPLCQALQGIVISTREAHGLFPRHPNCRCTPVPANVGEDQSSQKRGKAAVQGAISQSISRERPKGSKVSVAEQRKRSRWLGADKKISKTRPKASVKPQKRKK